MIKDILDNALPKAIEAGYFEGVLNEVHGIYDLETVRHKYKT